MAALSDAARRRILTIDIERLAGLTPIFDQRTPGFIPVRQWTRLPSLLCVAAKWHGTKSVGFTSVWDDGPEAMAQWTWGLYDAADFVVTFNGVRFDDKHLRSEWATHGLPPPRPHKSIDLYTISKKLFGFESKSLDHLCYRLELPRKNAHYDPVVAQMAFDGDVKAQRKMRSYNRNDVLITEAVYERLRPWIPAHPHVNVTSAELTCPRCGSKNLDRLPTDYLAVQIEYGQYRCADCSGLLRAAHTRRIANTRPI